MRSARKLVLLAIAAVAAMAALAPTVSATETVEVVNEKTATHCATTLTAGAGCRVHAAGVATLRLDFGIFGELSEATCYLEFEMRITRTAALIVDAVEHGNYPDPHCYANWGECSLPWSASGEEDVPGAIAGTITICINPSENDACVGQVPFDLVEQLSEGTVMRFSDVVVDQCEFDLDLTFESSAAGNAAIHVNHP